uniref:Uncharacterized protein n=1 Tax=Zea mays TaxID=4577 RepID=B4FF06_MAIZE|nr:unknown [Zea mays]
MGVKQMKKTTKTTRHSLISKTEMNHGLARECKEGMEPSSQKDQ